MATPHPQHSETDAPQPSALSTADPPPPPISASAHLSSGGQPWEVLYGGSIEGRVPFQIGSKRLA